MVSEEMVEAAAEALWHQCRSGEYDGFLAAVDPRTWASEDEQAKEVARDMARAALHAAEAVANKL